MKNKLLVIKDDFILMSGIRQLKLRIEEYLALRHNFLWSFYPCTNTKVLNL